MKKLLTPLLLSLLCAMAACTDIDKLSDANTVRTFAVTTHTPAEIGIGEAEITEDGTIYIPVTYGADLFPLTIAADLKYSGKIDRLLGVDFREGVTFGSAEEQIDFVVVAESGLARKYTLEPRIVDFRHPEYLTFSVGSPTPAGLLVYGKAHLTDEEMVIPMVEPVFPVSFVPQFDFGGTLSAEGFENGTTPITFNHINSTYSLLLTDNVNGSKRNITVRPQALEVVGSDPQYDMTEIRAQEVSVSLPGQPAGVEVKGFTVDNETDEITVSVASDDEVAFPLSVSLAIQPSAAYTGLVGLDAPLVFTAFDEPLTFYYGDTKQGIARRWTVSLSEFGVVASDAEVTSFSYAYRAAQLDTPSGERPAIVLDIENTVISSETAEVILPMTDVANATQSDDWTLELTDVAVTVSRGATFTLPALEWRGNDSWKTPVAFDVEARDGTVKTWTVRIRDARTHIPSAECDIMGATVREISPVGPNKGEVTIEGNTITIGISSDEGYYPLSISLSYTLSDYAKVISQEGNTQPLAFADPTAVNTVRVLAEDGTTTRDYQVKLNPAASTVEPNVRNFTVKGFSSAGFSLTSAQVDTEAAEIVLTLAAGGSCPVDVNYTLEMNRDVTASIPLTGKLRFTNLNQQQTFTATAGGRQKKWTVRIKELLPQLTNWQLDDWKDANTPNPAGVKGNPYWATANNSIVKGTSRIEDKIGNAAQLKTGTALTRLTSGSIFLGWFDSGKVFPDGLTDPVKLTFQGIPFSASRKLVGMEVDIKYTAAGDGSDTGSLAIELIKHNSTKAYVYHGNKPIKDVPPSSWQPHPDNTAVRYARGRQLVGNLGGTQQGENVLQVVKDTWTTVRVNIDYTDVSDPLGYTHLLIICASSSQGDVFIGTKDSTLIIDNIKLIYE